MIPVFAPWLSENVRRYVLDCVDSGWISSLGQYVGRFERDFAAFCEASHAVATSNGTTALHLCLAALDIGPADEVLVPNLTFVSTAFHKTDATHGKVEGQFTLLGKTAPVTFDVELIGAGKGFGMGPRLGVHASTAITPKDFGMMPMFDKPIDLIIDVEFEKAS